MHTRPTVARVAARTAAVAATGALACAATAFAAPSAFATSAAAATPLCATSQLTGSLGQGDAGAGNFYVPLVLTNHSSSTCHVKGYPGLSVLDAGGNQIGTPATYVGGATADSVNLAPGQSASGTIHTGTGSGTGFCEPQSAKVRVYPPGNRDALVFSGALKVCDHVFTVTPFAAGTAGNPEGSATVSEPTSATPVPSTSQSAANPGPVPSTGSPQVKTVPKGAPDTGVPGQQDSSSVLPVAAAAGVGAVVLVGGIALQARRRRPGSRV